MKLRREAQELEDDLNFEKIRAQQLLNDMKEMDIKLTFESFEKKAYSESMRYVVYDTRIKRPEAETDEIRIARERETDRRASQRYEMRKLFDQQEKKRELDHYRTQNILSCLLLILNSKKRLTQKIN